MSKLNSVWGKRTRIVLATLALAVVVAVSGVPTDAEAIVEPTDLEAQIQHGTVVNNNDLLGWEIGTERNWQPLIWAANFRRLSGPDVSARAVLRVPFATSGLFAITAYTSGFHCVGNEDAQGTRFVCNTETMNKIDGKDRWVSIKMRVPAQPGKYVMYAGVEPIGAPEKFKFNNEDYKTLTIR